MVKENYEKHYKKDYSYSHETKNEKTARNSIFKYLISGILILLFISIATSIYFSQSDMPQNTKREETNLTIKTDADSTSRTSNTKVKKHEERIVDNKTKPLPKTQKNTEATEHQTEKSPNTENEFIQDDALEREQHEDIADRTEEDGISTEGSTIDIFERINRKHAEERAKEEGVSTEGSTTDILERINRKHLERMNW